MNFYSLLKVKDIHYIMKIVEMNLNLEEMDLKKMKLIEY